MIQIGTHRKSLTVWNGDTVTPDSDRDAQLPRIRTRLFDSFKYAVKIEKHWLSVYASYDHQGVIVGRRALLDEGSVFFVLGVHVSLPAGRKGDGQNCARPAIPNQNRRGYIRAIHSKLSIKTITWQPL